MGNTMSMVATHIFYGFLHKTDNILMGKVSNNISVNLLASNILKTFCCIGIAVAVNATILFVELPILSKFLVSSIKSGKFNGRHFVVLPFTDIQQLKVKTGGQATSMNDFFSDTEVRLFYQELLKVLSAKEMQQLSSIIKQDEPIVVLKQTLPSSGHIYMPRMLRKRCYLDNKIFGVNSPDIFVISGISMQQLSYWVKPKTAAFSSDQLNEISARFILLEKTYHWCPIATLSKNPVHLLKFDPDEESFTLQKTQGASTFLTTLLGTGYEKTFEVSEEVFIETQNTRSGSTNICICASPGMGKSLLLTNLARIMVELQNVPIKYIKLSVLLQELNQKYMRNIGYKQAAEFVIYEYNIPSGLSRKLFQTMYSAKKDIPLSLFLDGLDEVSLEDQEWTKRLMREINKSFPNVKLYVTAKSHMRPELEKNLGFSSFEISPFCHNDQVALIVNHLRNNKAQKLTYHKMLYWVDAGVKALRQNIIPDDCIIAGIPLQCRLISEIILNREIKYQNNIFRSDKFEISTIMGYSLSDLLKAYVELHYNKHLMTLSKSEKDTNSWRNIRTVSEAKQIFQLFALQTMFPGIAQKISQEFNSRSSKRSHKINHECLNSIFIHQIVAEYLVAEYIAESLEMAKNTLNLSQYVDPIELTELLTFFFFTILATPCGDGHSSVITKHITASEFRCQSLSFHHLSVVHFLNEHLSTKKIHYEVYNQSVKFILSESGSKNIVGILKSSLRHDFVNIYDFVAKLLVLYKLETSINQLTIFVRIACRYSSLRLFKKLTLLLEETYSVTLRDICDFCRDNNMLTLVQYACVCLSLEKLKYLVEMNCEVENQNLLHMCAVNSAYDSNELQRSRVSIINYLIGKNKYLILEKDHQGNTPLFAENISGKIMDYLIQVGSDLSATNLDGTTMADHATSLISTSDFNFLANHLLEQGRLVELFLLKISPANTAQLRSLSSQTDSVHTNTKAIEWLSNQENNFLFCYNNPKEPAAEFNLKLPHLTWPIQFESGSISIDSGVVSDDFKSSEVDPSLTHCMNWQNEPKYIFNPEIKCTPGTGSFVTSVHNEFWGDQDVVVKAIKLDPTNYTFWDADKVIHTILQCCSHENIAKYHSINLCKEQLEIVTVQEYYKFTLDEWIKNDLMVKSSTGSKEILLQTTKGVAFLHEKNIMHGNIKPANIIVVQLSLKEIRVKVTDIEVSQILSKDKWNPLFGTTRNFVDYTAPDSIHSRNPTSGLTELKLSTAADIFSLGCVFYYVLSNGFHPFGSESSEIEGNIRNNKILIQPEKLKGPHIGYLHLIFLMIHENPKSRPSAETIKNHHIFWSRKVNLNFLVAVSNAADQPLEGSLISNCLDQIEKHPLMMIYCEPDGSAGWNRILCNEVQKYVQGYGCKRKAYCGDLIFDLLRAIRNMQTHYMTLPTAVKGALGETPSAFCDYWYLRFPLLVDLVWLTFEKLKNDTSCNLLDYYGHESDFTFGEYSELETKLIGRFVKLHCAHIILHELSITFSCVRAGLSVEQGFLSTLVYRFIWLAMKKFQTLYF